MIDVQKIIEMARQGHDPKVVDVGESLGIVAPALLVPGAGGVMELLEIKPFIDAYRERPERYEGRAALGDLSSFIDHANRFKDANSAIFISSDPAKPWFLSVLDYHEARNTKGPATDAKLEQVTGAAPRFGRHRGGYVPVFSNEWEAWTAASGKALTQEQFANLIQTQARDIYDVGSDDPRLGDLASWFAKRFARGIGADEFFGSSARMLECSEGLTATVLEHVDDVAKLGATGATKITFGRETKTSVDVPAAFVIEVPVFRGGDLWQLPVRLKYTLRVAGDMKRAEWRIDLFGAERTVTEVVKDMGETVRKATALPVFVGSPES